MQETHLIATCDMNMSVATYSFYLYYLVQLFICFATEILMYLIIGNGFKHT